MMVLGFVVAAGAGKPMIAQLRRLSFRQQAYEDAPATHARKTGTPTMGGLLFALALLLAPACVLLFGIHRIETTRSPLVMGMLLVSLALACGAIGFADDFLGVTRGKNKGLSAKAKFALTAAVAAVFLALVPIAEWDPVVTHNATYNLRMWAYPSLAPKIGFAAWMWAAPGWLWYALGFFTIVGTIHAVNLTDGLDGLAAGTIVPPLLLFTWIGLRCYDFPVGVAYVDALVVGAALGFLIFNRHPARVFMGDTGSLLLGGVLAGSAVILSQQLLLILAGGVFVAEALSVMIQVAYFKRTKKRIFRMSPLHHHFELGGWPETKVTARFWAASALLSLAAAACVGIGYAS